jgi:hypothetical protein
MNIIEKYEESFRKNKYDGDINGKNYFEVKKGMIPILVSAPHATNHVKITGEIKMADSYTGALACLLHQLTGCHVIYMTKQAYKNPNQENGFEYKNAMREIIEKEEIKLVIDLHAASIKHSFDIDFGTNEGKSIKRESLNKIRNIFEKNGIEKLEENKEFKANYKGNITHDLSNLYELDVVQLEIHKNYRVPKSDKESFQRLMKSLIEIIQVFSI